MVISTFSGDMRGTYKETRKVTPQQDLLDEIPRIYNKAQAEGEVGITQAISWSGEESEPQEGCQ